MSSCLHKVLQAFGVCLICLCFTLNHFHCYFDIGLVSLMPFIKDIAVVINILNYVCVCLISKSRLFSYLYTLVISNSRSTLVISYQSLMI